MQDYYAYCPLTPDQLRVLEGRIARSHDHVTGSTTRTMQRVAESICPQRVYLLKDLFCPLICGVVSDYLCAVTGVDVNSADYKSKRELEGDEKEADRPTQKRHRGGP